MSQVDGQPRDTFAGRTVLVTGGGSGIGRACAIAFARLEAAVIIAGRTEATLAETASIHGGIKTCRADIRHDAEVARLAAVVGSDFDGLDILINNAGLFARGGVADLAVEQMEDMFRTNVVAQSLVTRHCLPLLQSRGGQVVNISSTFARKAGPQESMYAATKAALESLTRSWAVELAPLGVRVNAIAPGPTDTPILVHSGMSEEAVEGIKRESAQAIPLGRLGEVGEIADATVALCSLTWVTGAVLTIDGGLNVA